MGIKDLNLSLRGQMKMKGRETFLREIVMKEKTQRWEFIDPYRRTITEVIFMSKTLC